jgi:hypothetical protein
MSISDPDDAFPRGRTTWTFGSAASCEETTLDTWVPLTPVVSGVWLNPLEAENVPAIHTASPFNFRGNFTV